jgi:hypothetical protein
MDVFKVIELREIDNFCMCIDGVHRYWLIFECRKKSFFVHAPEDFLANVSSNLKLSVDVFMHKLLPRYYLWQLGKDFA